MAIEAHLETNQQLAGKPREPRLTLRLAAQGALTSGGVTGVLVHNVSATGLLLESEATLTVGERIEIDLPHAGATWAKVIWTSGNLYGCQFDAPVSQAVMSAAQLRGAVGQEMDIGASKHLLPDESFGARLRRLRNRRELTLSQIAAQLGVSKPTVWAWEQGKARPVEDRIEALAEVLGVASAELLAGRDTPGLRDILARSREQIARAAGASPENVRIMIEL